MSDILRMIPLDHWMSRRASRAARCSVCDMTLPPSRSIDPICSDAGACLYRIYAIMRHQFKYHPQALNAYWRVTPHYLKENIIA
jgi:hypothetical protein